MMKEVNFADKVGMATVIASTITNSTNDLSEAISARYGTEAAWLADDYVFWDQINQRVTRDPETRVWALAGASDNDDEWDWDNE